MSETEAATGPSGAGRYYCKTCDATIPYRIAVQHSTEGHEVRDNWY